MKRKGRNNSRLRFAHKLIFIERTSEVESCHQHATFEFLDTELLQKKLPLLKKATGRKEKREATTKILDFVCVCVCVCVRERQNHLKRKKRQMIEMSFFDNLNNASNYFDCFEFSIK